MTRRTGLRGKQLNVPREPHFSLAQMSSQTSWALRTLPQALVVRLRVDPRGNERGRDPQRQPERPRGVTAVCGQTFWTRVETSGKGTSVLGSRKRQEGPDRDWMSGGGQGLGQYPCSAPGGSQVPLGKEVGPVSSQSQGQSQNPNPEPERVRGNLGLSSSGAGSPSWQYSVCPQGRAGWVATPTPGCQMSECPWSLRKQGQLSCLRVQLTYFSFVLFFYRMLCFLFTDKLNVHL